MGQPFIPARTVPQRLEELDDAIRKNKAPEKELGELLSAFSGDFREISLSHEEFIDAIEFLTAQAPDVKLRASIEKLIESIRMSEKRPDLMRLARQALAIT